MPRSVRDIAIVILLIGGGLVILLSAPRGRERGPDIGILHAVLRPIQEAVTSVYGTVKGVWRDYLNLVNVRRENEALKTQVRELKRERTNFLNAQSENRRLTKLLNLKSRHEFPSLVAQVIGEDAAGWYRTFFINRGSDDGVRPDMPVTAAEGLVGRISRTSGGMSQVLLITDPSLSADCRVTRTRDRGVLSGSLERGCVLRYLTARSDVRPGDEITTSGLDGVYPKGLPVGRVDNVRKGYQDLFLEATVTSSVEFSELEEVLVILEHRGGFDFQTGLEERR